MLSIQPISIGQSGAAAEFYSGGIWFESQLSYRNYVRLCEKKYDKFYGGFEDGVFYSEVIAFWTVSTF
jgi:hypothetical protein